MVTQLATRDPEIQSSLSSLAPRDAVLVLAPNAILIPQASGVISDPRHARSPSSQLPAPQILIIHHRAVSTASTRSPFESAIHAVRTNCDPTVPHRHHRSRVSPPRTRALHLAKRLQPQREGRITPF